MKNPVKITIERSTYDLLMKCTKDVKCHMLTEYDERLLYLILLAHKTTKYIECYNQNEVNG